MGNNRSTKSPGSMTVLLSSPDQDTPDGPASKLIHTGEDLLLVFARQLDRRLCPATVLLHGCADHLAMHRVAKPAQDRQRMSKWRTSGEEIGQRLVPVSHLRKPSFLLPASVTLVAVDHEQHVNEPG